MKPFDPFCYFSGYASAISGFGGTIPFSDPRYCFHTIYTDVAPGRALYHLSIHRPQATYGELNVRVMALSLAGEVSLVASIAIRLGAMDGKDPLLKGVRFMAVAGVKYALYGFVTDKTDLQADRIDIALEELGASPPQSKHSVRNVEDVADRARTDSMAMLSARRLLSDLPPDPTLAYAQPMTPDPEGMAKLAERWPHLLGEGGSDQDTWSCRMALQLLDFVGALTKDSYGLLVNTQNVEFVETLKKEGCHLNLLTLGDEDVNMLALEHTETGYDFAVVTATAIRQKLQSLESLCDGAMDCLGKGGGMVMSIEMIGDDGNDSAELFRNRMQQLSLHCIGRGHEVMQMAFPNGKHWYPPAGRSSRFVWMARR